MTEVARESRLRSILKALSWRVIATTTIITIAYFTTGDIQAALEIGAIEFFIKFALYYMHERAWQLAPRGSIRKLFNNNPPLASADDKHDFKEEANHKASALQH